MSLNRHEQITFDYLQGHPEESRFWQDKVQQIVKALTDEHAAALRLEGELWAYYVERSGVVEPFRGIAAREGLRRLSMRNLADHLIRLWTAPRPKKKPPVERP